MPRRVRRQRRDRRGPQPGRAPGIRAPGQRGAGGQLHVRGAFVPGWTCPSCCGPPQGELPVRHPSGAGRHRFGCPSWPASATRSRVERRRSTMSADHRCAHRRPLLRPHAAHGAEPRPSAERLDLLVARAGTGGGVRVVRAGCCSGSSLCCWGSPWQQAHDLMLKRRRGGLSAPPFARSGSTSPRTCAWSPTRHRWAWPASRSRRSC